MDTESQASALETCGGADHRYGLLVGGVGHGRALLTESPAPPLADFIY